MSDKNFGTNRCCYKWIVWSPCDGGLSWSLVCLGAFSIRQNIIALRVLLTQHYQCRRIVNFTMTWRYIKRVLKVNDDKDLAHLFTSTVCSSIFSCPESGVEGIGKENEDEDGEEGLWRGNRWEKAEHIKCCSVPAPPSASPLQSPPRP